MDVRSHIDVASEFPALAEGIAHFDGPGGTQVPAAVADAVAASYRSAVSNRHGDFASSARSDGIVDGARQAAADLLGADPRGIVFGASMTANTYVLAGAFAKQWGPGDEVVVSRLDHDANIRPWVQAAARAGATVRWAEVTPEAELVDPPITERTRFVALTAASNATGTRPDVARIVEQAHAVGALVHVDGVHATPHAPVSPVGDLWACSAYKWYGPHLGVTAAAPELLETLHPDKLLPSTEDVPDRFELGTPAFAQLVAMTAAVDWIASHGSGESRRDRLVDAMTQFQAHEEAVFARLLSGLTARGATLVGSPARRTPTVAFRWRDESPQQTAARLGAAGVAVWAGDYYATELMQALGLAAGGGAVRAGVVAYTSDDDVDRLLECL